MIDRYTQKPIQVQDGGKSGPYVRVRLSQLKEVEKLLKAHGFSFWTDERAVSVDDKPYVTVIHLRHGTDPEAVQAIFDSAA